MFPWYLSSTQTVQQLRYLSCCWLIDRLLTPSFNTLSQYLSSTQTLQLLVFPLTCTTATLLKLLLTHSSVIYPLIQHIIPVFKLNPDTLTSGISLELYNSYATQAVSGSNFCSVPIIKLQSTGRATHR